MNKNLKLALKNRSSEQGFAIPIAVGMGLIMILVATTMIVRSQGDRTTASAQEATNRGLSAAETGITRYQSLINSNRAIATYKDCEGIRPTSGVSKGVCPDTGTTISWANASAIPGLNNTCTGNVSGGSVVLANSTTDWRDIDSTTSSKGQYRLIDYVYQPDSAAATTPGIGTLRVAGRVNQVGSNNAATEGIGTATTQLKVKIRVARQSSSGAIPGLWIRNVPQNMAGNLVRGNILVAGCTIPPWTNNYGNDPQRSVTPDYKVTANPNGIIPDAPPRPTSNLNEVDFIGSNTVWGSRSTNPLPRTGDRPQSDGSYAYLIKGNLTSGGSQNITLSANAKVVFYVQGNIDLGGGPNINNNGDSSKMQIYGNTFERNSDGTIKVDTSNRPLTKYGCPITLPSIGSTPLTDPPSTYAGACPTLSVTQNGNGSIHALIHAADATGSVSGGGGNCDPTNNTGFIGALWIKNWNAASGSGNELICAEGDYGSFLATQTSAPPSIPAITAWQREEL